MITKHLPLDPRENTQIQLWSPVMKPLASFTSSRGWMNKENGGTEMFGCQDRSPDGAVKKGKGGGGERTVYRASVHLFHSDSRFTNRALSWKKTLNKTGQNRISETTGSVWTSSLLALDWNTGREMLLLYFCSGSATPVPWDSLLYASEHALQSLTACGYIALITLPYLWCHADVQLQ